jgi:hypothetical protein
MKRKMFGHMLKKRSDHVRTPGEPYNDLQYEQGDENEDSYKYVKGKDFPQKEKSTQYGRAKDAPPNYEGREHIKYQDPGYSSHHIRFPEDEPHMKSHVTREEEHEMEDNFHHDVPDQTHYDLQQKIKRARMKMDAPDQEDPDELRGNLVTNVGQGEEDTSGEEEMGPNDMQSSSGMPKEHRKKMIVAIAKRKMKKAMKK